jgi:hypothetical protein
VATCSCDCLEVCLRATKGRRWRLAAEVVAVTASRLAGVQRRAVATNCGARGPDVSCRWSEASDNPSSPESPRDQVLPSFLGMSKLPCTRTSIIRVPAYPNPSWNISIVKTLLVCVSFDPESCRGAHLPKEITLATRAKTAMFLARTAGSKRG